MYESQRQPKPADLSMQVRWLTPLAAVGRLSLTNYLTQTLIFTTLFYGYGLGWFGKVSPSAGIVLIAAIYAFQVAISHVWLRYFRYGPVEWLWRALTYGRVPANRAREITPTEVSRKS